MIIDEERSTSEFGKAILQQRADSLLDELLSLKRRPDEKAIHDARVQSRRLRAALEAFQDLFAPHPWQAVYRSAKEITRTLGGPRETGVIILLLRNLGGAGDMAESLCREYLMERFQEKLKKQEKRLKSLIKAINPPRLRSRIAFLLAGMELPAEWSSFVDTADRAANKPNRRRRKQNPFQPTLFLLHEKAQERAQRILRQLMEPILAFRLRYDFRRATDDRIHALRIGAKQLRYAMEIFDPIWPGGLKDPIAEARALQDAGGDFHDWCVLCQCLKTNIRRLNKGETVHLAFQIGRLLAFAEDRRAELRKQILPALTTLQATLHQLLGETSAEKDLRPRAMAESPAKSRR
jgi:CHAD domain-containing protein